MKLLEKKAYKATVAFLLAFVMCVGLISAVTPMNAKATDVLNTEDVVTTVANGDFESGSEGEAVPNWSKTAMLQGHGKETDEEKIESYCSNYSLTTVMEENGNQVAAFEKNSTGYVAATSDKVAVNGGQKYCLSFDYKTAQLTLTNNAAESAFYGIRLYVEELDASGNITAPVSRGGTYYGDGVKTLDWKTGTVEFETQADTTTLRIYLWMGGNPNVFATVHFDNVSLEVAKDMEVTNGDFESGRNGYSVRNWSKTAMLQAHGKDTNETNQQNYENYFLLTTVAEADGNKVAAFTKSFNQGFMAATSEQIAVTGGQLYNLSFDYRLASLTNKASVDESVCRYYGIRLYVEELDADGNITAPVSRGGTYYGDDVKNSEWQTGMVQFQAKANTKKVVIYLWMGGNANVSATVHFDNVSLEASDDYKVFNSTYDKVNYLANGGKAAGVAGPTGWSMYDSVGNNYAVTTVQETGRGNAARITLANTTAGNTTWLSPYIAVDGAMDCSILADYKLIMEATEGVTIKPSFTIRIFSYDTFGGNPIKTAGKSVTDVASSEWIQTVQNFASSELAHASKATKYIRVGMYVALDATEAAALSKFELYVDDIALSVAGELTEWTAETSLEKGEVRDDNQDFTANYSVRQVSDGTGHEDALQLYVSREGGILGGVTFYSKPMAVTGGSAYTTSFDLKVDNSDASAEANVFGASYVVRYLDSEGNVLERTLESGKVVKHPICLTGRLKEDMTWTHYNYEVVAPENAASVQIGLVIGGYKANTLPNLTHTFDNIIFMESDLYEEYTKDPAVTASSLYKQSALFVGDMIGSGMAEMAASYSEMQVTNACSDTTSIEEQLLENGTGTFDYVVVSSGSSEIQAQIPAGTVTDDTTYMNGVPFDTTTFAGMVEQLFAKVAEYQEAAHVVYVLSTDADAYKAVAEAAAAKWNVTLVVLADVSDATKNWNDAIEPAERAVVFNSYDIPGMKDYVVSVVDAVATEEGSLKNMVKLDDLLAKAQMCPNDHVDYDAYITLAGEIQTLLVGFEAYYPTICGATIAKNDANQLRFIAKTAIQSLPSGIQVKKMGILVTPLTADAQTMDIEAAYTGAGVLYDAILSGAKADPAVEYEAQAYVIYEEAGAEHIFYSRNDYVNELGEKTASGGVCVKSVYGIAKDIALKIAPKQGVNCAAIGGSSNIALIENATEETEVVALQDVFCLVSDNKEYITKWLNEGGAF